MKKRDATDKNHSLYSLSCKYIPGQITKSKIDIFCFLTHTNGVNYSGLWITSSTFFSGLLCWIWVFKHLTSRKASGRGKKAAEFAGWSKGGFLAYHTHTTPSANLPVSLFNSLESNLLNCKLTKFCTQNKLHRKAKGKRWSSYPHSITVYLLLSLMFLERRSSSPHLALQSMCNKSDASWASGSKLTQHMP